MMSNTSIQHNAQLVAIGAIFDHADLGMHDFFVGIRNL